VRLDTDRGVPIGPVDDDVLRMTQVKLVPLLVIEDVKVQVMECLHVLFHNSRPRETLVLLALGQRGCGIAEARPAP
jgi:hypothetical protein